MVAARSEYGDDKNCEMKHEENQKRRMESNRMDNYSQNICSITFIWPELSPRVVHIPLVTGTPITVMR